jgi:hypothetical protein
LPAFGYSRTSFNKLPDDLNAGFALRAGRLGDAIASCHLELSVMHVQRTCEFTAQKATDGFTSLTLTVKFLIIPLPCDNSGSQARRTQTAFVSV